MATEIHLTIQDDGAMVVSQGEEGENATPAKSIAQALQIIQQMAEAASMQAPEAMEEQGAMEDAFNQKQGM